MPTINWTVENVRVNLPSISAEEYPITVPSSISAYEVIENSSKVNYLFCFGDEVFSNSYTIDNGKVIIDTPDLSCELDSNTITVSEKTSGGGSGGDNVLIINVTENDGTYSADKTYDEAYSALIDGKIVYLQIEQGGGKYLYINSDFYPPDPEDPYSLCFYVVNGPYYSNDNLTVTMFEYSNENVLEDVSYSMTVTPFTWASARLSLDATKYTINYSASSLYNRIENYLAVVLKYTVYAGAPTGEYEYIVSATKSGTDYTFKTLTKTFTASSDNANPVCEI